MLTKDTPQPHNDEVQPAGSCDVYNLRLNEHSVDLEGRLFIEWGDGTRAWVQRADNLKFRKPLSEVAALPKTWIAVLKQATGVYLLTCPKTREQYVGSACGDEGFWQRWMEYVTTGHGGNVALKSREYSDYQVSILEVAGSSANPDDIRRMESNWKVKLQSREMGLNRN